MSKCQIRYELLQIIGPDNKPVLKKDTNGNHIYTGDDDFPSYQSLIDNNPKAKKLYGTTGGFQAVQGGWYLPGLTIPYSVGSVSDMTVESFAGTHDYLGGQIWGWYGQDGNTSRDRTWAQNIGSSATTVIAIPVSAPFALSDIISSDMMQIIFELGK